MSLKVTHSAAPATHSRLQLIKEENVKNGFTLRITLLKKDIRRVFALLKNVWAFLAIKGKSSTIRKLNYQSVLAIGVKDGTRAQ